MSEDALIYNICLPQKRIPKQMRLVNNREPNEGRREPLHRPKRFVGMIRRIVAARKVTAVLTVRRK